MRVHFSAQTVFQHPPIGIVTPYFGGLVPYATIDDDYKRLKKEQRNDKTRSTLRKTMMEGVTHQLTPLIPSTLIIQFQTVSQYQSSLCSTNDSSPIIEPVKPSPTHSVTNNVQDVSIYSDYSLYSNPDKPLKNTPIELIYDTGAAISMMPEEYTHAWTNLRTCLHSLTGCFSGQTESNLQIGEFHGIITLDSGETRRAVIPECIQIPQGMSNTYLLADTAFLLAGHQYVSHLSQPKLKFKGGGQYTMTQNHPYSSNKCHS